MRATALLALTLVGCDPEAGPPLTRLVDAWAEQAAGRAEPMVTGSLLLAAAGLELCQTRQGERWSNAVVGDAPPFSDSLQLALGEPEIRSIKVAESGLLEATLGQVEIAERTDVRLQISTSLDPDSSFVAAINALVLPEDAGEDGTLEVFGRTTWTVQQACGPDATRLTGTARWEDEAERSHAVQLPADLELSTGVRFDRSVPYIPSSGTLSWESRLDGQEVSLITDDAEKLEFEGEVEDTGDLSATPAALWDSVVRGSEWSARLPLRVGP